MSNRNVVLILHGWGGNKPEHWQEWLAAELRAAGAEVHYPRMPDPASPRLAAWIAAVHDAVRDLPGRRATRVVCHSLGAITWMHYATVASERLTDQALLVAPPYVSRDLPPADTPPGIAGFFPPPLDPNAIALAAGSTVILYGEGDCYGTEDQTKAYADALSVPMHAVAGAGHISPYWGYGSWPWVLDWCLGKADLPPVPR